MPLPACLSHKPLTGKVKGSVSGPLKPMTVPAVTVIVAYIVFAPGGGHEGPGPAAAIKSSRACAKTPVCEAKFANLPIWIASGWLSSGTDAEKVIGPVGGGVVVGVGVTTGAAKQVGPEAGAPATGGAGAKSPQSSVVPTRAIS